MIQIESEISPNVISWQLCDTEFFYCPQHGKCPAILEREWPNGIESIKTLGVSNLFYCEACGMVKIINIWGNCSGLAPAKPVP
jgi:hypothetical protein